MNHPWTKGIDTTDIINFYNYYLTKFDKKNITLNSLSLGADATASLMVIDMQNDFILPPPGVGFPPGRFSVANGLSMTGKLAEFIRSNSTKFHKIIFTRDTHPINHCSFFTEGGPFPPHCIINHQGAALHPSMVGLKDLPNADVIFKGCVQTADSFGAYKYEEDEYLKRRQLGQCCPNGLCGKDTGGFYLNDFTKKWEDYPFSGVNKYPNTNDAVLVESKYPDATYENIKSQIGKPFELDDIIPAEIKGNHTIFICGLAGDYCVKDTALNLAKDIKTKGLQNINIVILQPFTRYAFLPLQYIGGYQVYKNKSLVNTTSGIFSKIVESKSKKSNSNSNSNSKSNSEKPEPEPKDINQYLFIIEPKSGTYKLLTKKEAENAAGEIIKIKHPWEIKNANATKIANESNPKLYAAFLTPINDILNDYSLSGIKIVMNIPDLHLISNVSKSSGGRRHYRKKTRKVRRHYRNRKRTYKH
jgi:nicotinamidase-related amidase